MGGPDFVYASGLDHSFFNWQTLVFTMFQVWKGNVHNMQNSTIRVGMEGGSFSIGGGVHIPWVESYGIWTPGSIFNGGPYSISQRQGDLQTHHIYCGLVHFRVA